MVSKLNVFLAVLGVGVLVLVGSFFMVILVLMGVLSMMVHL